MGVSFVATMKLAALLLSPSVLSEGVTPAFSDGIFANFKRCPWEEILKITCLPNSFDLDFTDGESLASIFKNNPLCMTIDSGLETARVYVKMDPIGADDVDSQ